MPGQAHLFSSFRFQIKIISEGAVQLVGDVGVSVEDVAGRVGVCTLVLPDKPVAD